MVEKHEDDDDDNDNNQDNAGSATEHELHKKANALKYHKCKWNT